MSQILVARAITTSSTADNDDYKHPIATRIITVGTLSYELDDLGFNSRQGKGIFIFSKTSVPAEVHPASYSVSALLTSI